MGAENVLLVGCGDLGMRVARHLAAHPGVQQLWALRRHSGDSDAPVRLQWLSGDVTKPATLNTLPQGITRVVVTLSPGGRNEAAYRAVFTDGLRNVMHALGGQALKRLVFVSSSAVYGEHHGDWVDESTAPAPLSYNGKILLEAENWLAAQPLSTVSVRLAGIYGPGRLQLLERIRQGRAHVPRDVQHWANRIHVEDAARAISHLLLAATVDPVYIVADDTPQPLHQLYDALAAMVDAPAPPAGPPPAAVGSKRLSNARLRATGFTLQWPDAREGYRALIA